MSTLFHNGLTKADILRRVGNIHQIAGAEEFEYCSGMSKGTRGIRIRNGLGLDFIILPDKGMDIMDFNFRGIPLHWMSENGVVNNKHFDRNGNGWLNSFAGGALVTCGLRNVGPPVEEEGEKYGLHGDFTSLPAQHLSIKESWKDQHFHIEISGKIIDPRVFGNTLCNYRTIEVSSQDNLITIKDRVVNKGASPEPVMLLYHFNWGSPLFCEDSILKIIPQNTEVRDCNADSETWGVFQEPQSTNKEIVYLHELQPDNTGYAGYEIINPNLKIGVNVKWNHKVLPYFTQWKMCGEATYVLGLEPGNCFPTGRINERKNSRLETIPAFGEKEIEIILQVTEYE